LKTNILQLQNKKKGLQRQVRSSLKKKRKPVVIQKIAKERKKTLNLLEQKRQLRCSNRDLKVTNHKLGNEIREKQKTIEYLQVVFEKKRRREIDECKMKLENFQIYNNQLQSEQKDLMKENDYLRSLIEDNEEL
jgi:hypothetical protein